MIKQINFLLITVTYISVSMSPVYHVKYCSVLDSDDTEGPYHLWNVNDIITIDIYVDMISYMLLSAMLA